ncbi:hypothetical protein D3C86_1065300 [compost metagenome]
MPASLQQIGEKAIGKYLDESILKQYDNAISDISEIVAKRTSFLFKTTEEIALPGVFVIKGTANVQITTDPGTNNQPLSVIEFRFNATLRIPDNVGFIQLDNKLKALKEIIVNNINGSKAQRAAVEKVQEYISKFTSYAHDGIVENVYELLLKKVEEFQNSEIGVIISELNEWRKNSDNAIKQVNDPNKKNVIIKARLTIDALFPLIDLLRKTDPYFYYTEQERLKKQINDIKSRFFGSLIRLFGNTDILEALTCKCAVNYPGTEIPVFESVLCEIKCCLDSYNENSKKFIKYLSDPTATGASELFEQYNNGNRVVTQRIADIPKRAILAIKESVEYKEAEGIYKQVDKIREAIRNPEAKLKEYLQHYKMILQQQASQYAKKLDDQIQDYILKRELELIEAVGPKIIEIQDKINQAKTIYHLLTSIKQQDLSYVWSTDRFRDVNLGIVSFKKFSNPDTKLQVNVKGTTYFSSGKFPPVIERVEFLSENRFTNFGISFFNSLTIGFNEISFLAGTNRSTHFEVKIKDVKFDGALSFVQAFEKWLQTMGKGLILQVLADRVSLGYSLPIPAIKTPGFNIFNLSLNLDLRLYFDNRPLRFGFSLARPDSKFGIAVGIYAGFGFFGIEVDPKRGIVSVDCALEAGAWSAISMGPIHGEVKLAFGFRYTKNEFGVRLEGYVVAEGRLKVWILEVSARIYLGSVSENSYVEGICTVTYTVKLKFIKRSFSGTFHRKIAGAKSNNQEQQAIRIIKFMDQVSLAAGKGLLSANASLQPSLASLLYKMEAEEAGELETNPVSYESWKQFINIF